MLISKKNSVRLFAAAIVASVNLVSHSLMAQVVNPYTLVISQAADCTQMGWYNNGKCTIPFGGASWTVTPVPGNPTGWWGGWSGSNGGQGGFSITSGQYVQLISTPTTTTYAGYDIKVNGVDCGVVWVGGASRVEAPYLPYGCSPIYSSPYAPTTPQPPNSDPSRDTSDYRQKFLWHARMECDRTFHITLA